VVVANRASTGLISLELANEKLRPHWPISLHRRWLPVRSGSG